MNSNPNFMAHLITEMPHDRARQLQALGLDPARLDHLLGLGWVRPAQAHDASALAEIYNQTALTGRNSPTDSHATVEEMAHMIQRHSRSGWALWVCLAQQQVAGFVLLRPFSWGLLGETAERAIYISKTWRGIGLGDELMTLCYALAEQYAYLNVTSWIFSDNPAALALARKTEHKWAYFPSLARSAGELRAVDVFGREVGQWFATAQGREARRRQMAAATQSGDPAATVTLSSNLSLESALGISS